MSETLKVVTLNTWGRSGPWAARRAVLVDELVRLAPDIVGLQEVWEDGAGNTAREIASATGQDWHVHYGAAHQLDDDTTIGNAILSRHPFVGNGETWRLPQPAGDWARNIVFAMVATPWGHQPVFVTHLSWMFHWGSMRLMQLQQVRAWLKERAPIQRGDTPAEMLPPIVMGDMNCVPESDEIRFVTGLMADGYGFYLADCFALAGEGAGLTWDRRNPFAAQEPFPSRRLDYIFVRGPDRWRRGEPVLARVVFEKPVDDVFASDHFGVYAEIRVR